MSLESKFLSMHLFSIMKFVFTQNSVLSVKDGICFYHMVL